MSKFTRIHETIRQDLIDNVQDLFYRYNYYTKKYRSKDPEFDVHVGLFLDEDKNNQPTVHIYLANKYYKMKEVFVLNNRSEIISETVTLTLR